VQVIERFAKIVKRYLELSPIILGILPYETNMDTAITLRLPFITKYPDSTYAKSILSIVKGIPLPPV
jgi:hypothetical protein